MAVFGSIDAQKLRTSMTLFAHAADRNEDCATFRAVLVQYFGGLEGTETVRRLPCLNRCRLSRVERLSLLVARDVVHSQAGVGPGRAFGPVRLGGKGPPRHRTEVVPPTRGGSFMEQHVARPAQAAQDRSSGRA